MADWNTTLRQITRQTMAWLTSDPYEYGLGRHTSYTFAITIPTTTIFEHQVLIELTARFRKVDAEAFRQKRMLEPERQRQFLHAFYHSVIERVMRHEDFFIAYGCEGEHPREWDPGPRFYRYEEHQNTALALGRFPGQGAGVQALVSVDHGAARLVRAVLRTRRSSAACALRTSRSPLRRLIRKFVGRTDAWTPSLCVSGSSDCRSFVSIRKVWHSSSTKSGRIFSTSLAIVRKAWSRSSFTGALPARIES